MIKGAVQRRVVVGIIKIKDYIAWKQPELIKAMYKCPATDYDTLLVEDNPSFREWKRLMEESPKPGTAGGE